MNTLISYEETVDLICNGGHLRTVLVEGHMGTGKSQMLRACAQQLPNHRPVYFDCTTKDLGDLMIPDLGHADGAVRMIPNEELSIHDQSTPTVIMFDELGKANPAVFLGVLRLILEREMGAYKLHPETVVFATTNLGEEGVGDLLPAHARNRLTVVRLRKPDVQEWLMWGVNNNINASVLAWVKDNPQLFDSFEDVDNPDDNPDIYHPRSSRSAFVTPRSLETASVWADLKGVVSDNAILAALAGAIGEHAARNLMAFVNLAGRMPTLDEIKTHPETCLVPDNASIVAMTVMRSLVTIEASWATQWTTYMQRLVPEAQALFVNSVRDKNYARRGEVMTNGSFTKYIIDNAYMFGADV